jgi:hypothetical protein
VLIVEDRPTIAFDRDGRFGLYGGCNRFTGKATIDERTIVFPQKMAGTREACAAIRAKLEKDVLDALSASSGYVRNGALLSLTNSNGITLVRFKARSGWSSPQNETVRIAIFAIILQRSEWRGCLHGLAAQKQASCPLSEEQQTFSATIKIVR